MSLISFSSLWVTTRQQFLELKSLSESYSVPLKSGQPISCLYHPNISFSRNLLDTSFFKKVKNHEIWHFLQKDQKKIKNKAALKKRQKRHKQKHFLLIEN